MPLRRNASWTNSQPLRQRVKIRTTALPQHLLRYHGSGLGVRPRLMMPKPEPGGRRHGVEPVILQIRPETARGLAGAEIAEIRHRQLIQRQSAKQYSDIERRVMRHHNLSRKPVRNTRPEIPPFRRPRHQFRRNMVNRHMKRTEPAAASVRTHRKLPDRHNPFPVKPGKPDRTDAPGIPVGGFKIKRNHKPFPFIG